MRLYVDPRYREERDTFQFKSTCEHCVHFESESGGCSLTYPSEPHREAHQAALQDGDALYFCKTFEVD